MTETPVLEGTVIDSDGNDVETEKHFGITTKGCVKFVARSSVKFVVAGIVSSLVPEPETKIQRVKVAVGTYVIAGAVAKSTLPFVEDKFDELKKDFREIRAAIKKLESEQPIDES